MNLPYRHDLLIRVTVADDGIHADGHGAMATARKLATLIPGLDEHVVDCSAFPADVTYLGKNDGEAPDPSPGGTFTVTQGGNTTAPIPYDATMSEINQAADDAGVELTFGLDDPPAGFDSAGGAA